VDCTNTANVEFIVGPKVYSKVDEFTAICTRFSQMAAGASADS